MRHAGQPAEILALGLVTPVGLDAPSAAAALRAGVNRVRDSAVLNRHLDPHRLALVPEEVMSLLAKPVGTARLSDPHARMLRLAIPALQQVLGAAGPDPVPLFLGLPEVPAGDLDSVGETFLADLIEGARPGSVQLAGSKVCREGGAAGLFALRAALDWLAGGAGDVAVAGAVDTFLDLRRLASLDAQHRLLSDRVAEGFLPGEGAAMLLVATPDGTSRLGAPPVARVLSVATGSEPGHRYSAEPCKGDGLARTFQDVFASAPSAPPVRCVYAGFNGESLPAKEWGVAYLRSSERFARDFRVEHPADCIGDAGAALGSIMLAAAATGLSRGYRGSPCLVWSTSDRAPRAAALLGAPLRAPRSPG